jgi:putative ATP-dependent endonuclease of OLD family
MGQFVKTFVSDEWTLEYDLALGPRDASGAFPGGLAKDVYVAACLAEKDEQLDAKMLEGSPGQPSLLDENNVQTIVATALEDFASLENGSLPDTDCSVKEVIATHVYAKFVNGSASKAIAAQHLAERLQTQHDQGTLTADNLRARLPTYLVDAIDYVTSAGRST